MAEGSLCMLRVEAMDDRNEHMEATRLAVLPRV